MKFIVTGGGTAGHINPAITIADALKEFYAAKGEPCEIIFTGRENGLEGELVPKAGYEMKFIEAKPFPMKPSRKMVKAAETLKRGGLECDRIIDEYKPDAVIGTGGYVCAPLLLAAMRKKIPVILHEANAFPGRANKTIGRRASLVLTGFPNLEQDFPKAGKVVFTGNPIRKIMFGNDISECRKKLGLSDDDLLVFAMGGSLGAKTINDFIFKAAADPELSKVKFVLSSGKQQSLGIDESEIPSNVKVMKYIDEPNVYLCAADISITRAGAVTCAETAAVPSCSVLIPYPYAAHDHQTYNASAFADVGGCVMMSDSDVSEGKLLPVLKDLLKDKDRRMKIRENAAKLAVKDCSERITGAIDELLNG